MKELIKISHEKNQLTVSARELHNGLEIDTNFTTWFKRMCEYGFVEEKDFFPKMEESTGGRPSTDYDISVGMAKEICMIQRSEQGKQYRQYFLKLEDAWNTPEQIMARALKMADKQINGLKTENMILLEDNQQMKPKALFADAVATSRTSILIGELAKILKQNGVDTGEKRLFEYLRNNGYLIRRKGTDHNAPTQRSMELELFEVKETAVTHSDGHVTVSKTTKVTGKGQLYFTNKFLDGKAG